MHCRRTSQTGAGGAGAHFAKGLQRTSQRGAKRTCNLLTLHRLPPRRRATHFPLPALSKGVPDTRFETPDGTLYLEFTDVSVR